MVTRVPKHLLRAHRLISGREDLLPASHSKAEYRNLVEVRSLFKDRDIAALGIAEKIGDNTPTGELALCFYVTEKKAKKGLRSSRLIPPVISVGGRPVFTDVCEIGHLKAHGNAQAKPIQSGFSLSNSESDAAGTLGAIVRSGAARYILSNTHVLAPHDVGNAPIEAIYPTWPGDTNSDEPQAVGVLRDFVKLTESGNTADAALAEIYPQFLNDIDTTILRAAVPHGVADPEKDMVVVGNGRSSGPMQGTVKDCNCHISNVDYSEIGYGAIGFVDQVMCTAYAQDGDSGALMVAKDTGKIVGLHVGGSDQGSFFTPIKAVQAALKIKFSFL